MGTEANAATPLYDAHDPNLAGVIDQLGVAVAVVDRGGLIRYRNRLLSQWLGQDQNVVRLLKRLRVLQRFDHWEHALARVSERDDSLSVECLLPASVADAPSVVTVECRRFACDRGDGVPSIVVVVRPSPSAHEGDRLEVSKRLAAIGKLATRVAHELNNPLDGIIRYVNLALRVVDDEAQPKLSTYLSESRTGLMRMVQIIGDLLEFSRSTETSLQETGFNDVVDEAIRQTAAMAQRNQVIVAVDYQSHDMPGVRGSRLFQVCTNLIKNAIDAMPGGGRLTVTTGRADGGVVLRVEDTGPGLPESCERVFAPFFTTKPVGQGTGLGLAICKDFIEDMGGRITAANGAESGAVFTVYVPDTAFTGPTALGVASEVCGGRSSDPGGSEAPS